jgi:hypothetical protein
LAMTEANRNAVDPFGWWVVYEPVTSSIQFQPQY